MKFYDDVNSSVNIESMCLNARKVHIEGHRGGKFDYDNTISAFHKAVKHGLNSIEFDVWLTKDYIPVVIHGGLAGEIEHAFPDLGIKETTLINDLTLEQIKMIELPNGEKIPTLKEVLTLFNNKIIFNCEVKEGNPEFCQILLDLISDFGITRDFVVSSFVQPQLDLISELSEKQNIDITLAYCYEFIDTMRPSDFSEKGHIITFDFKCMSQDIVKQIQDSNKKAAFYFYPVSDETDDAYSKIVEAGVDIIISDRPEQLQSYLLKVSKSNQN